MVILSSNHEWEVMFFRQSIYSIYTDDYAIPYFVQGVYMA